MDEYPSQRPVDEVVPPCFPPCSPLAGGIRGTNPPEGQDMDEKVPRAPARGVITPSELRAAIDTTDRARRRNPGLGIAGLVFAILGLLMFPVAARAGSIPLGFFFVIGVVCATLGLKKARKEHRPARLTATGFGIAGVGTVVVVIMALFSLLAPDSPPYVPPHQVDYTNAKYRFSLNYRSDALEELPAGAVALPGTSGVRFSYLLGTPGVRSGEEYPMLLGITVEKAPPVEAIFMTDAQMKRVARQYTKDMAKAIRQAMPGASGFSGRLVQLGGLRGLYVEYRKDSMTEMRLYRLYRSDAVIALGAQYMVGGLDLEPDMLKVIKSFKSW